MVYVRAYTLLYFIRETVIYGVKKKKKFAQFIILWFILYNALLRRQRVSRVPRENGSANRLKLRCTRTMNDIRRLILNLRHDVLTNVCIVYCHGENKEENLWLRNNNHKILGPPFFKISYLSCYILIIYIRIRDYKKEKYTYRGLLFRKKRVCENKIESDIKIKKK